MCRRKWKWQAERRTFNLGWGHTYTNVTPPPPLKIPNNNEYNEINCTGEEKKECKN